MRSMSCVRMRVAMSDWWASRIEVSVIRSCFCSRIHFEKASGPFSNKISRLPVKDFAAGWGTRGERIGFSGFQPLAVALPLTVMSER